MHPKKAGGGGIYLCSDLVPETKLSDEPNGQEIEAQKTPSTDVVAAKYNLPMPTVYPKNQTQKEERRVRGNNASGSHLVIMLNMCMRTSVPYSGNACFCSKEVGPDRMKKL